jgi:hypothetical protein
VVPYFHPVGVWRSVRDEGLAFVIDNPSLYEALPFLLEIDFEVALDSETFVMVFSRPSEFGPFLVAERCSHFPPDEDGRSHASVVGMPDGVWGDVEGGSVVGYGFKKKT